MKSSIHHKLLGLIGLFCVTALSSITTAFAQEEGRMSPIVAPEEIGAISLGTGSVKGANPESWFRQWGDPMARNISTATLTPFLADPKSATGVSVIIAPGGGFMWLSMGNEGWEVAKAFSDRGVNAFVLKYRLRPTTSELDDFERAVAQGFAAPDASSEDSDTEQAPRPPAWDLSNQMEDVEAAYALITKNATKWNVDPKRIGMVGFSAGAMLTVQTALNSEQVDLAFIGSIYGGMGPMKVTKDAPPMFTAIATDDFLFAGQFGIVKSWFDAEVAVEFHLYQNGGHGFGLGNPNRTSNTWFKAFINWMDVNDF
ncbi:MAG: esterase [Alphaproteobacteria bacterium]|nr:MAG: esterase [Alphaproteobacteria bacterium]